MSEPTVKEIAIIGAGLAGMTLALSLHSPTVHCSIYETRPADQLTKIGGAIVASPNALRVLEDLGLYNTLRAKGYSFEKMYIRQANGAPGNELDKDIWYFGNEEFYGYKALRLHRRTLLEETLAVLEERGVPIHYQTKFSHIVSESDEEIHFGLADGSTRTANLLIGADGIHSKIRKQIYPSADPEYMNFITVACTVPTAKIRLPEGAAMADELPTVVITKAGACMIVPQNVDGSDCLVVRQLPSPERGSHDWHVLMADKDGLRASLQEGLEDFPEPARSALELVSDEGLFVWPFYNVPDLESWVGRSGKVILIGDAAHALPPISGNGANQAIEDAYTLALAIGERSGEVPLAEKLSIWENYRKERIGGIIKITRQMMNRWSPPHVQAKLAKEYIWQAGGPEKVRWLFGPNVKKELLARFAVKA